MDLSMCHFRGEVDPEMNAHEGRIAYYKITPDGFKPLLALENYLHQCGLEQSLLELVKLRASQINGCAYCIDMHSKDALAAGETPQRLVALDAWSETPFYTDRERAALEWTEVLTLISQTHAPDDVYERVRTQYSEKEIVDLTIAVGMINVWSQIGRAHV